MFDLKANNNNHRFSATSWQWRPIHLLCDYLITQKKYEISTMYWDASSGFGIDNQEECDLLAIELEKFLNKEKFDDLYVNLGKWVYLNGKFVEPEIVKKLNAEYKEGYVLFTPLVTEGGDLVAPIHKTTFIQIEAFIKFLNNCGGFKIW